MQQQILRSKEDRSINYIVDHEDGGKIESRFVQRLDDTIIVYLSSTTGCNLACRFCHLTQTGQTTMTPVDLRGYYEQAREILSHAEQEGRLLNVKIVHFNFMARGDVLANPNFTNNPLSIMTALAGLAERYQLIPKFKLSSIFPKDTLDSDQLAILKNIIAASTEELGYEVEFYYSLYSLDEKFRKRWLPKAMDPELVGQLFAGTVEKMRLHYALIKDENDGLQYNGAIKDWLMRHDIKCRMNIVRYNPYNYRSGQEASTGDINTYRGMMNLSPWLVDVHVVTRVGGDVYASCGQFVH